ncbi:MAG: hypothetical protein HRU05_13585 [Oceanospirillaceae bacterium]|nr:hypothetical protein [Oceanospirillaceae bacterium]
MHRKTLTSNVQYLGKIQAPPPGNSHLMSSSELFIALVVAGDWSYPSIVNAIHQETLSDTFSEDTVKSWALRNKVPRNAFRKALFDLIQTQSSTEIGQQWIRALIGAWTRQRLAKGRQKNKTSYHLAINTASLSVHYQCTDKT